MAEINLAQLIVERDRLNAAIDDHLALTYTIFGRNLRRLRTANRWTQDELAEWIGLSRSAIAKLESGASGTQWPTVCLLADLFKVSPDAFPATNAPDEPPQGATVPDTRQTTSRGPIVPKAHDRQAPTPTTDPTLPISLYEPIRHGNSDTRWLVPGDWPRGQALAHVAAAADEAFTQLRARRVHLRFQHGAGDPASWPIQDGALVACDSTDPDAERYWQVSTAQPHPQGPLEPTVE